jgi:hypothetical protein
LSKYFNASEKVRSVWFILKNKINKEGSTGDEIQALITELDDALAELKATGEEIQELTIELDEALKNLKSTLCGGGNTGDEPCSTKQPKSALWSNKTKNTL